jgi:hypothetical protein
VSANALTTRAKKTFLKMDAFALGLGVMDIFNSVLIAFNVVLK